MKPITVVRSTRDEPVGPSREGTGGTRRAEQGLEKREVAQSSHRNELA